MQSGREILPLLRFFKFITLSCLEHLMTMGQVDHALLSDADPNDPGELRTTSSAASERPSGEDDKTWDETGHLLHKAYRDCVGKTAGWFDEVKPPTDRHFRSHLAYAMSGETKTELLNALNHPLSADAHTEFTCSLQSVDDSTRDRVTCTFSIECAVAILPGKDKLFIDAPVSPKMMECRGWR